MQPRFSEVDVGWAQSLRESYQQLLAQHLDAIQKALPNRQIFAWQAVANDYRQLALVLYASGEPVDTVRGLLCDAARAHLGMVRLRGNEQSGCEPTALDYSVGNSCSTYRAICEALLAHDLDLAQVLATFVWDPPEARYVGPTSVVCTDLRQGAAYALRYLLLDEVDQANAVLASRDRLPEDVVGEYLMLRGLVSNSGERVVKGVTLALAAHARLANEPENYRVPDYFLHIPALGLASCALQRGLLTLADLPSRDVYLPRDMIVS